MNNIATWTAAERIELFEETAARKGITPAVVEKDFWVCWVLGKLFTSDLLHDKIIFKGGTSLSKVFKLIERFSEDIDLILNWLEITEENPALPRSHSQQQKLNEKLLQASQQYIRQTFLPELVRILESVCKARISDDDPHTICIDYPITAKEGYLRPEIRLESGPLAAWTPNDEYAITPYAAEEFPGRFKTPGCKVMAIKAERTFWEKATILHAEAFRPESCPTPPRHSRHYYDMVRMADAAVKEQAFADLGLLSEVVAFKNKFYHSGWAHYDQAQPGSFKLIPPVRVMRSLNTDYREMQAMFFGPAPLFSEIMDKLATLETEINAL